LSSPVYTWSDVINNFLEAVKNVLYEIGNFIVQNASAIGTAIIGLGVAYGIYRAARRALPFLRGFALF
jgi:hypothetical protein